MAVSHGSVGCVPNVTCGWDLFPEACISEYPNLINQHTMQQLIQDVSSLQSAKKMQWSGACCVVVPSGAYFEQSQEGAPSADVQVIKLFAKASRAWLPSQRYLIGFDSWKSIPSSAFATASHAPERGVALCGRAVRVLQTYKLQLRGRCSNLFGKVGVAEIVVGCMFVFQGLAPQCEACKGMVLALVQSDSGLWYLEPFWRVGIQPTEFIFQKLSGNKVHWRDRHLSSFIYVHADCEAGSFEPGPCPSELMELFNGL